MKKIGLFLDSLPHSGGKFQYSQSMLEGIATLPKNKFSVVIAYSSEVWRPYLTRYNVQTIFLSDKFWRWFFDRIWRNIHLSINFWRWSCPYFFRLTKTLIHEQCDVWIFPSEDTLIYQIPVPLSAQYLILCIGMNLIFLRFQLMDGLKEGIGIIKISADGRKGCLLIPKLANSTL